MVRRITSAPLERQTLALEFHDGGYVFTRAASEELLSGRPRIRRFEFELCRKSALLGDVPVDQFWFARNTLYGQRHSAARNQQAIVDCFWSLCFREGSVLEDDVQDSYILLKLLPDARSNGSRRIFEDAVPTRLAGRREAEEERIAHLESMLAAVDSETDLETFRDRTAELLGPPEYPPAVRQRYQTMEQELLGAGRDALQQSGEDGLAVAMQQWQAWMRTVGRRSGNAEEKLILDIFSYECRAALHRAYSAVWAELLPRLVTQFQLTRESELFHRLWHLDLCGPPLPGRRRFHLFHGHVFGLHPAAASFIQTPTGAAMIGAALREGDVGPAFRRLLSGLLLAVFDYAEHMQLMTVTRNGRLRRAEADDEDQADYREWQDRMRS